MKINHDFHIHTSLSLCACRDASVASYIEKIKAMGIKKAGFSNHYWEDGIPTDIQFYTEQNFAHVDAIRSELSAAKCDEVKIYYGCEAEFHPTLGVGLTEKTAEKFDYIIVPNSHTHMTMPKEYYEPYEKHRDFMIDAYYKILDSPVSKYITAMAHPFEAVCCPYDNQILIKMITDDCFKRMFDKTAEKGIAVEINVCAMKKKTDEEIEKLEQIRLFRIAKECGCKFIFGSDEHNVHEYELYDKRNLVAELLELTEDDITDIAK